MSPADLSLEALEQIGRGVELPKGFQWSASNRSKFKFGADTATAAIIEALSRRALSGESPHAWVPNESTGGNWRCTKCGKATFEISAGPHPETCPASALSGGKEGDVEALIDEVALAIASEDGGPGNPLGYFPQSGAMRTAAWEDFLPEQHEAAALASTGAE